MLQDQLEWMKQRGSSVSLNWGEDNNLWEASWITGGERFTGESTDPLNALAGAVKKAQESLQKTRRLARES
jgi:hypothetical protein